MIKNNEYPFFTVIIPQKDRAEYIGHTLKTCMIQDYPNFEVIVSDDCSEDNSVEVIQELAQKDSRIKLFAHKSHLGMHDNFEFALNQVKPGYVMALGGDDGLTPGCIWRMYNIIKETGIDLLTWEPAGFSYAREGETENIFKVSRRSNKLHFLKSTDFLNHIASSFNYMIDECPMFYVKGIASTELVNRVKSRTKDGCFYYCPTPDGFSGVVLAGEVDKYVYTHEPLSIMGTTHKSQGQNYKRNDEKSVKESDQFFNDNTRRTMHEQLASQPYSPLITLMTADYLLTAKDLPGWHGNFKMFSFENLLRKSFSFIANSSYDKSRMVRELQILREIAKQHDLMDLFNTLMKSQVKRPAPIDIKGLAVTNSFRMDGSKYGINNIYDACLATNIMYNLASSFKMSDIFSVIKNTFKIVKNSRKKSIDGCLPKID